MIMIAMNIEELVVKHVGWIRAKAGYYHKDEAAADDLASETIYRILSNGFRFDASRSFKPWAQTIMENIYKMEYNRRKCMRYTSYGDVETVTAPQRSDQLAVFRSMMSVIRKKLKESVCIECVLLYAKGYDYSEIASKVGIPIGTVRSRISAGRKMLRNSLE